MHNLLLLAMLQILLTLLGFVEQTFLIYLSCLFFFNNFVTNDTSIRMVPRFPIILTTFATFQFSIFQL